MCVITVNSEALVGFEVLTVASMTTAVFWVVVSCSLVEVNQRFRGTCCLHLHSSLLIVLMMEAASTSEMMETSTRLHCTTTQKTAIFSEALVLTVYSFSI
jgi:hypothetical protein